MEFLMALFRVEQIETPCCVLLYIYLKRLQASNMVGADLLSCNRTYLLTTDAPTPHGH